MIEDIPPVAVAPPEPEAVRAPRPLVREEGIEPDLDLASASTNGEPAVRQAPSSDAHVEPEVEPTIAHPEAEAAVEPPTVEAGSSRSEAEIEDAGQPASTAVPPIAHAEAAPAVEPEADAPARREPVIDEAAPGVSEEVEGASTVVIDEQGEEGPGEEPPKPEPEADRAPKRRWSLFRRGGDR
jgi:hypothetical protein